MKFWIAVAGSLIIFAVSPATNGQTTDTQLTVQHYVDAQNAGDLEVALALWADDGTIINTRGRSVTGKENLKRFIEGNIRRKIHQKPESIQVIGRSGGGNEKPRRSGVLFLDATRASFWPCHSADRVGKSRLAAICGA